MPTPEPLEQAVVICDRCACLVASSLIATHDRACGGLR